MIFKLKTSPKWDLASWLHKNDARTFIVYLSAHLIYFVFIRTVHLVLYAPSSGGNHFYNHMLYFTVKTFSFPLHDTLLQSNLAFPTIILGNHLHILWHSLIIQIFFNFFLYTFNLDKHSFIMFLYEKLYNRGTVTALAVLMLGIYSTKIVQMTFCKSIFFLHIPFSSYGSVFTWQHFYDHNSKSLQYFCLFIYFFPIMNF